MNTPLYLLMTEGSGITDSSVLLIFIFVISIFLGVELIAKVPSQLHTPLMSGSNAISGITVVGAILAVDSVNSTFTIILGTCAVALAMINVMGGYLVTNRMLGMFRKKEQTSQRKDK